MRYPDGAMQVRRSSVAEWYFYFFGGFRPAMPVFSAALSAGADKSDIHAAVREHRA
jgi:hypothetical protein